MKWEGFAYAAGAAVGHSCIDVSRKMAAQNFSPAELIALVGLLDALVLCALVWAFGSNSNIGSMESLFQTHDQSLLRILVISAGLKVMAGYMYQRALQVSPISVTVPYLAFTPVMLVFTSYFLMNEMPSFRGLLGVVVVTVGGYMLVVEKHGKITRGNQLEEGRVNHTGESFNISLGAETKKAFSVRSFFDWILSSHIFEPFLALRKEEGSLLMLAVAGVFSISNSLDKMGTHLSPSPVLFAAVQRVVMAIPVVFYLILIRSIIISTPKELAVLAELKDRIVTKGDERCYFPCHECRGFNRRRFLLKIVERHCKENGHVEGGYEYRPMIKRNQPPINVILPSEASIYGNNNVQVEYDAMDIEDHDQVNAMEEDDTNNTVEDNGEKYIAPRHV